MLGTWRNSEYVKMTMPPRRNYSLGQFQQDYPEHYETFHRKLDFICREVFDFNENDIESYRTLLEAIIKTGLVIPRVIETKHGSDVGIFVWSFCNQEHVQPNMAEGLDMEIIDHMFSTLISTN